MTRGIAEIAATTTMTTCGEACWRAREDVCRCYCGGANHGVLRSGNGERPTRTRRVGRHVYELEAVFGGTSGDRDAHKYITEILEARGVQYAYHVAGNANISNEWADSHKDNPYRFAPASKSAVKSWPELSAYRDSLEDDWAWYRRRPYCVWRRV